MARLAAPASTTVRDGVTAEVESADLTRVQTVVRVVVANRSAAVANFHISAALVLQDARGVEIWTAMAATSGKWTRTFDAVAPGAAKRFTYVFRKRASARAATSGKITLQHFQGWTRDTAKVAIPFRLAPVQYQR
ncbi:hypothetical protein [Actinomadura parmotrematis]|uniref:CBM2 domain-containing protein n=1 Tax=Actinomadura parmotrematis TaxID=2864039 RepID=A0ABS7FPB8_9ACTN|nr:hypothetical protein [Actinomadura parmotrematis]MBW8482065.1 hypothetical protein [Actinomadura parmotrematis]